MNDLMMGTMVNMEFSKVEDVGQWLTLALNWQLTSLVENTMYPL